MKIKKNKRSNYDVSNMNKKDEEGEETPAKSKGLFGKDKKEKPKMVGLTKLFQFASKTDWFMMGIGTLGAIANGVMLPLFLLVFTSIIDSFSFSNKSFCSGLVNATLPFDFNALENNIRTQSIYAVFLGIGTTVFNYFQVTFWMIPAENAGIKMRKQLFTSIMRQNIGWFDVYKGGDLTSRLTEDINKVKMGVGDRIASIFQYVTSFLVCIIISFVKGWKLTLVILSVSPLLLFAAGMFAKLAAVLTTKELKSYAKAGSVAEEVISSIRTVLAFNGSKRELSRYEKNLEDARMFGIKRGFINGAMLGFLWLVINCAYALGFWYGWTLTENVDADGNSEYSVGKILLVFYNVLVGVFSLGNAGPAFEAITTARAAAFEIFEIMERKSEIDPFASEGDKPNDLIGKIEFRDVSFKYPSRPEVPILNSLSLKIEPGTSIALVGSSGCGKSTCVQLLQRFYDPASGSVLVDGKEVKSFNLSWLRSHIGIVNQEPILFGTTIYENIKFGKENATDEEIKTAAIDANAHEFIMSLPKNYQTLVGDRGGQLSGGQKQRIAIARALVRNPKVLLLDEATSALDNESEAIVQSALDRARQGRTTIIIAHRLSTIINADVIFAIDKGQVKEFGTHSELMAKKGLYYNLVVNQQSTVTEGTPLKLVPTDKNFNSDKPDFNKNAEEEADEMDKKQKKKDKKKEKKKDVPFSKMMGLNKPEWYLVLLGCIGSIIAGGIQPTFAIILSKATFAFSDCSYESRKSKIELFAAMFVVCGVANFFANIVKDGFFGISGENLTKRLRSNGFKTILTQEIGWFDDQKNNVGSLCTKLAVEAAAVQGATGKRLGFMIMNVANLGVGIIISFAFAWPITLCILAFAPIMVLSGILQVRLVTGFAGKDKDVIEEAGKITNEAISNIRTVCILTKEKYFVDKYTAKLMIPYIAQKRSAHINGIMLGVATSIVYYAVAAAYSLGAYCVRNNLFGITLESIMLVFGCIMIGAQSAGQAASLMPDYGKAKAAVISMFELLERVPSINNWESSVGDKLNEKEFKSNVSIKDVEFTYPSRPDAKILKTLRLDIKHGERVAFVGSSGCGKSTVTQLIERFYDPSSGTITLDGKDIKELNLHWLRAQLGIVSQEPVLFDLSIEENIAYGDSSRVVTSEEIEAAAKQANIHDFISNLPNGYKTNVGAKGTQLSGGQKQRIAIARSLIRNPKILLLDEATSALDTESEKIVQEALNRAQQGRTCIIIAHRLSTIRTCDRIFVFQNGVVTESGTHDELIRLNGFYAKLNGQQTTTESNESF